MYMRIFNMFNIYMCIFKFLKFILSEDYEVEKKEFVLVKDGYIKI
jgi:hypothetical protein